MYRAAHCNATPTCILCVGVDMSCVLVGDLKSVICSAALHVKVLDIVLSSHSVLSSPIQPQTIDKAPNPELYSFIQGKPMSILLGPIGISTNLQAMQIPVNIYSCCMA